ncbi:MAG: trehalose 6-phosphate synthase, partial [Sphingomonadales bacterium]|nr:trehalose 6-phosphate synthase [Sphingomonadales bacterium]
ILILSRFAGAALQLKDALLVNPYSKDDISDAIRRAIEMPREERIRRWRAMNELVEREDVVWWRKSFVEALERAGR